MLSVSFPPVVMDSGLASESPRPGMTSQEFCRLVLNRSARFGIPDIMLGVKLKTEAGDELKLRFEEVDVLFLIAHQLFEKVSGHVVLGAVAVSRRLLIK